MDFEIPAEIQATLDALDEFIEREIKPLEAAGRQHPVLRPPPRVRPHRLRGRRHPPRRLGGAARARCAAAPTRPAGCAGRCPAEYGGHDAINLEMAIIREHLADQGPRAAQRPAERELDRRQLPDRADDARLRHATSRSARVDAGLPRRHAAAGLRPHRAEPRLATRRTSRPPPCATATSG